MKKCVVAIFLFIALTLSISTPVNADKETPIQQGKNHSICLPPCQNIYEADTTE